MVGDGVADSVAVAVDEIDCSGGEACLLGEFAHLEGAEWCSFGCFDDDSVARCDGGADFPRKHEKGKALQLLLPL